MAEKFLLLAMLVAFSWTALASSVAVEFDKEEVSEDDWISHPTNTEDREQQRRAIIDRNYEIEETEEYYKIRVRESGSNGCHSFQLEDINHTSNHIIIETKTTTAPDTTLSWIKETLGLRTCTLAIVNPEREIKIDKNQFETQIDLITINEDEFSKEEFL